MMPLGAIAIESTRDGPEPQVTGSGRSVAEIVHVAYAQGLEAAARLVAEDGHVDAALRYCAERACDQQAARCRTCRLWSEDRGITTLDALLALLAKRSSHLQFSGTTAQLALNGGPEADATSGASREQLAWPGSLEDFARTWAGEEVWFIARRTLRRIEHNKARAGKLKPGTSVAGPVFILVAPQMADNIGMVARAMANFALEDLRLVAPRTGWPNDKARYTASGAHTVIDAAKAYEQTDQAVADLHWVCATTARPRQLAKPVLSPDEAVAEMIRRMGRGERCGVLFGPERTGLSTDDVANADATVMVRVNPAFASINLAQTVLLMAYEWLKQTGGGAIGRHTEFEGVAKTGLNPLSPPATKAELLGFFEHLESELTRKGHFKPEAKRQTMVRNLRAMFERMGATQQEVRTLRGIVASLARSRNTGEGDL
jgi:tRNA/rRNA methyltransferase